MTKSATLSCLVVDDDPMSRTLLEEYVARHDSLRLIGSCVDAVEASNVLRRTDADIILLDIEMPAMSGIELARTIHEPTKVILVSGKTDYAVDAFDVDVTDYLLKPVSYARFLRAVRRAVHAFEAEAKAPAMAATASVFVRSEGKLVKIALSSVHWLEAQGDYVLINMTDRRLMTHATMKALADKLPSSEFVRVHRSYIVRLDSIDDVEDSSLVIGRTVIPIGASYRQAFMEQLEML